MFFIFKQKTAYEMRISDWSSDVCSSDLIYMDNGPVSRSRVFQSVMGSLGVRVLTHLPPKADDRHTAARAKGKVERPFRTVKEVHEMLYHFHKPKDEAEANLWMRQIGRASCGERVCPYG